MPEQRKEVAKPKSNAPLITQQYGVVEGQLVIFEYASENHKYVIAEMYDDMMIIRNNKRQFQIEIVKMEEVLRTGKLKPLTKNAQPVLGKRKYVLFGDWIV